VGTNNMRESFNSLQSDDSRRYSVDLRDSDRDEAQDGLLDGASDKWSRKQKLVLTCQCIVMFMGNFDFASLNVALQTIETGAPVVAFVECGGAG
jgi:hypothetical protein